MSNQDKSVPQTLSGQFAIAQAIRLLAWCLFWGLIIGGSVARIAPTARETAGVVSYIVTVEVDPTDAPLRAGMNSVVNVITEIRDGVLVIPNRMIRIDRSTGRSYVNVLRGDQAFEVEIITGLRSDLESEVLQGLNEGDVLVILPSGPQLPFGG